MVVGISTKWQIKLHDGFIENFTDLCSAAAADKLPGRHAAELGRVLDWD